jgi:hypothetical protein
MNGKRHIAVWSGPRNISTALMRSWGSRPDTYVCDEPLYAHYLLKTGIDHPGRDEVIASQDNDWRSVAEWLTGDVPEGKSIFYQKHMAHHLLTNIGRDWLSELTNVFLVREPREMLTSLIRVTPAAGLEDTGLPQQWEMFTRLYDETGAAPAVIDARDVLENPRGMLVALCAAVGVPFMDEMLSWEPGPRETDGVWAKHWYGAVEASTGFEPYRPKEDDVPPSHLGVLRECEACYERLYAHRLTA